MTEKIIDEVMALVRMYGDKNYMQGGADANDRELQSNRLESDIHEKLQAIRAKLRELLVRKPLTDEQIDSLWGGENVSVPQLVNRRAISRSIERAHGIGS